MNTPQATLTEMLIPESARRHYEPAIPTPPTPHNLRQAGWRVVIHHLRRGESRSTTYASARKISDKYLGLGEDGGYEMQATGGFTKVELWEPHRRIDHLPSAVGTARCSQRDAYCKKVGVEVALRRALASLRAEVR